MFGDDMLDVPLPEELEFTENYEWAQEEPQELHYGYDKEFAIGAFTTQVGSYDTNIDGQVHTIKPGDQFSIWAYENKTTGFDWMADLESNGPCKG